MNNRDKYSIYDLEEGEMGDGFNIGKATSLRETDKAVLVLADDLAQEGEIWIPKSQIHDDSEVFKADQIGYLIVSSWYAEKKGWM